MRCQVTRKKAKGLRRVVDLGYWVGSGCRTSSRRSRQACSESSLEQSTEPVLTVRDKVYEVVQKTSSNCFGRQPVVGYVCGFRILKRFVGMPLIGLLTATIGIRSERSGINSASKIDKRMGSALFKQKLSSTTQRRRFKVEIMLLATENGLSSVGSISRPFPYATIHIW